MCICGKRRTSVLFSIAAIKGRAMNQIAVVYLSFRLLAVYDYYFSFIFLLRFSHFPRPFLYLYDLILIIMEIYGFMQCRGDLFRLSATVIQLCVENGFHRQEKGNTLSVQ